MIYEVRLLIEARFPLNFENGRAVEAKVSNVLNIIGNNNLDSPKRRTGKGELTPRIPAD